MKRCLILLGMFQSVLAFSGVEIGSGADAYSGRARQAFEDAALALQATQHNLLRENNNPTIIFHSTEMAFLKEFGRSWAEILKELSSPFTKSLHFSKQPIVETLGGITLKKLALANTPSPGHITFSIPALDESNMDPQAWIVLALHEAAHLIKGTERYDAVVAPSSGDLHRFLDQLGVKIFANFRLLKEYPRYCYRTLYLGHFLRNQKLLKNPDWLMLLIDDQIDRDWSPNYARLNGQNLLSQSKQFYSQMENLNDFIKAPKETLSALLDQVTWFKLVGKKQATFVQDIIQKTKGDFLSFHLGPKYNSESSTPQQVFQVMSQQFPRTWLPLNKFKIKDMCRGTVLLPIAGMPIPKSLSWWQDFTETTSKDN